MNKDQFHTKLVNELTALDRREAKGKAHNPWALGHYLSAAKGVTDSASFARAFIPTRGMHTVAKRLGLGLDVERGNWVPNG
jgi:hypothetical protein